MFHKIILLLMNGDHFETIYRKYFNILHSYSRCIVKKEDVAEDIVQEVFLECWDHRKSIDVSDSLKPYLYTLTRRKSIDYLRKSENKNIMFSDFELHLDQLFFETLASDDPVDRKEMEQIIKRSIQLLSPKCKEVFILSREEGLKNKQIALKLDISIKAVEKHITKALKEIRNALEEKELISFLLLFFFPFS